MKILKPLVPALVSVGVLVLGACSAHRTGPDAPRVLRPQGVPASDGLAIQRPDPIRVEPGGFARSTTEPEIFDTRDLPDTHRAATKHAKNRERGRLGRPAAPHATDQGSLGAASSALGSTTRSPMTS